MVKPGGDSRVSGAVHVRDGSQWRFATAPFAKATLGDRLEEVISFRSVTASGSGGLLVDGLSFDAPKNSITAVLATPLATRRAIARLANGIDRCAEGSVFIDEIDISAVNMTRRRRTMGWVADRYSCFRIERSPSKSPQRRDSQEPVDDASNSKRKRPSSANS
jgi:ABC-type multidrug transport system fused ATPase/permease subunit